MTLEELAELLPEDATIFSNPDYADAIVGYTHEDRVIYSYTIMVECLIKDDEMTYEEASEYIDHNVIRAIPYMGETPPSYFI